MAPALLRGTLSLLLGLLVAMSAAHADYKGFAYRDSPLGVPGVRGGVVTSSEPNGAQAGAEILRAGGNAIDAAVAVAFALNVVEPQSAGIGGGGFMVIYLAKERRTVTVDSRETAPANADSGMFVPFTEPGGGGFSAASTSGIAVGVPGMLRGVELALKKWGRMSLGEVLQPAIRLAEDGFRVGPRLAASVLSSRLQNELGDPAYDEARSVFLPGGDAVEEGDLLVQPDLAKTLRLLAEEGADAFYTGKLAEAIVATQQATRSVNPAGVGRMTLADLAGYQAKVRKPVSGDYRGYTIKGMGPPSSGPLTVLHALKLVERFPVGDATQGFGFGATRTLNVYIEAMRLGFADRAVWMGDADFVDVPVDGLLDDDYIALRSALIDPDSRQDNVVADDPRPFDTAYADAGQVRLAQRDAGGDQGRNTTHFSVVDADGNIVSYTNTIESGWGTGLMVPGYGFLLNNELTDFNFVPAFNPDPANFNPGANDVAPGKRPRSSMSPVIVFRHKTPVAAFGSPGGSTIINSVAQVAQNLIDHGFDVQEAVDAPRVAQTSANGSTAREIGFSEAVIEELSNPPFGHSFRFPGDIGSVQAVVIDPRDKHQYGAADRRRVGGIVTLERDELPWPGKRKGWGDDKSGPPYGWPGHD
jgi:gamma-glutamyltranspeptidase/glutathione hydrolase